MAITFGLTLQRLFTAVTVCFGTFVACFDSALLAPAANALVAACRQSLGKALAHRGDGRGDDPCHGQSPFCDWPGLVGAAGNIREPPRVLHARAALEHPPRPSSGQKISAFRICGTERLSWRSWLPLWPHLSFPYIQRLLRSLVQRPTAPPPGMQVVIRHKPCACFTEGRDGSNNCLPRGLVVR